MREYLQNVFSLKQMNSGDKAMWVAFIAVMSLLKIFGVW